MKLLLSHGAQPNLSKLYNCDLSGDSVSLDLDAEEDDGRTEVD